MVKQQVAVADQREEIGCGHDLRRHAGDERRVLQVRAVDLGELEEVAQAERDPSPLREAPVTAPVRRLDEARAARKLVARWHKPSAD